MGKRRHSPVEHGLSDGSESDTDGSLYDPSGPTLKRAPNGPRHAKTNIKSHHVQSRNNGSWDESFQIEYLPPHSAVLHKINSGNTICASLLQWYAGVSEARGMPWRKPYNPSLNHEQRSQRAYEVWVSEIMLQQTQVSTVIPYYNRWMERFPTIRDLASASLDEVNSIWKGLGYYSRASRLHAGAKKVVDELGGKLPENAKDMQAQIPGIGRYSAGAICSIAYGECVPVLDGNVHRLLSRFLALHAPPKAKSTLDILWSAATEIVQGVRDPARSSNRPLGAEGKLDHHDTSSSVVTNGYSGDVNQALIELGSTVCKVRDPDCGVCPLRHRCSAYLSAISTNKKDSVPDIEDICHICEPLPVGSGVCAYPMKADRKKPREELDLVNVIEWRSETDKRWCLLVKRPEGGLLAGLLEFPSIPDVSKTISPTKAIAKSKEMLASLFANNITPTLVHVGDVVHIFSHIKKTYRIQWVLLEGSNEPPLVVSAIPNPVRHGSSASRTKTPKKRKLAGRPTPDQEKADMSWVSVATCATWTPLEEISDANISTGMLKVWDMVQRSWSKQ